MPPRKTVQRPKAAKAAQTYKHTESTSPMRPEIGTQSRFKKKLPAQKYRYDSSLSPALDWDGQNPAREMGEWLLRCIEEAAALPSPHAFTTPRELRNSSDEVVASVTGLQEAVAKLKALGEPFLDWAGKAERLSFDVPSLPLFIHERLSTKAILETLKGHKRDRQETLFDLFGDPEHSGTEQVLRAYEHRDQWVNRMMLGDSLVVMNSLLRYERMGGGQVQMIYMDPPYGVKFGSNFQPFVRKERHPDVKHNDDASMTREPEMVQAYRDTWELGLHSYLTYLRDRVLLARELLADTGSLFIQISDQNVHHVRELLDEIFGPESFISLISFQTTTGFETKTIAAMGDYLLWYAKDPRRLKINKLFQEQPSKPGEGNAKWILFEDGTYRGVKAAERRGEVPLPKGRLYQPDNIVSQGASSEPQPFSYLGKEYRPPANSHWKANYPEGMNRLAEAGRLHVAENSLRYRRFESDFPFQEIGNIWTDTGTGNFTDDKLYVVQTNTKVLERCILLATNPGDLVLDPTCGSGTTALIAEHWGRRWITCDTSRVPLALARQRLLTATFPWYRLKDSERGPAAGFVYERKQNKRGEEIGGIVPHVTLESIANLQPPKEEILADRPAIDGKVTRVTGSFCFEATIPTPMDWDQQAAVEDEGIDEENEESFTDRMLEVLRRSPVLRLEGNRTVTLKNVRRPARSLSLSAEALVDATAEGQVATLADAVQEAAEKNGLALAMSSRPVAFVFGPENGAVSVRTVEQAALEARQKGYTHLYVIGFAIEPNAREAVDQSHLVSDIPATYVQATPDLMMGDLLKNMRSSQIFSVCGLPEVKVRPAKQKQGDADAKWEVELLGLDVFDPVTMTSTHRNGNDVPAWFLDTDYNGMCFHVSQAFFPRTNEWDKLKKALKGEFEDSVWEHLAGTVSAPFSPGDHKQIAVKVIDDRGNELLVVKRIG